MTKQCGYFLEMIEHERGWGSKSDGYVIFNSKEDADHFIKNEYHTRNRSVGVPDYYVNYEHIGWKPLTDKEIDLLRTRGAIYRN